MELQVPVCSIHWRLVKGNTNIETQRRQYDYEGHNTPLCYYTDQGP